MSSIVFADPGFDAAGLAAALDGHGVGATPAPDHAYGSPATDTPAAETAAALTASERLLSERRPPAVILAGDGDRVLAAGLAASKLEIPLVAITPTAPAGGGEERNRRLLELLADLAVAPGEDPAGAIDAWLRDR